MTVIATTYCGGEERESKKEVTEYGEEYDKKGITETETQREIERDRQKEREKGRERERKRLRLYDLSWY